MSQDQCMNHWQLLCNSSGNSCHNCKGFHSCISCHVQRVHLILTCVEANFVSFLYLRLSDSFIFCLADSCDVPRSSPFANHTHSTQLPSGFQLGSCQEPGELLHWYILKFGYLYSA